MFKKHMTPLQPHSKPGTLHKSPNKGSSQRTLPGAASGGAAQPSFQSYGKATPMAGPDPSDAAPVPDGLGSGSWAGNGIA
jgi:hypothetical protein